MIRAVHVITADTSAAVESLDVAKARAEVTDIEGAYVWVELVDPTRAEMDPIAEQFALTRLEVDDAMNYHSRAKIDFDNSGEDFAIIKTIAMAKGASQYTTGQTAIFVGPQHVITVAHGANDDLTPVLHRILEEPDLRKQGPMSVLYGVFDLNVDDYLRLAEAVTLEVNEHEIDVFNEKPSKDLTQSIYALKRRNIEARRAVSPLYTEAVQFSRETESHVPKGLLPYFQDVGEHLLRVLDTVEANDSLLLSMLMASTSLQELQQNKDMRKISAWVAIAAVPTMVAGIYGMNFDNMPELHWEYSYYFVIGGLVVVCGLLYRAFKKSGWL
mgnify:CR=1 FL=1